MNCSAWARRTGLPRLLLPLLLAVAVSASAGSTAEFDDLVARLQFAFYTGDNRALEEMLAELDHFQVEGGLAAAKSYQLAYGNWKLAQLLGEPRDTPCPSKHQIERQQSREDVRSACARCHRKRSAHGRDLCHRGCV